jgi:hypothetical protein
VFQIFAPGDDDIKKQAILIQHLFFYDFRVKMILEKKLDVQQTNLTKYPEVICKQWNGCF